MPGPSGERCKTCYFFEVSVMPDRRISRADAPVYYGRCHRTPPTPEHPAGEWATTSDADWCGEHKPRKAAT